MTGGPASAEEAEGADDPQAAPPGIPEPLPAAEVPAFLEPYGYLARDSHIWRGPPPELTLQVSGHSEIGGHTHYHLECTLQRPAHGPGRGGAGSKVLAWKVARRLAHLRGGLHDPVRRELGSSYQTYFCGISFAHRLGPSGTTARLDAWFRRLAYCVGAKLVPPVIAAAVIRVLMAPLADADASGGFGASTGGDGSAGTSSQSSAADSAPVLVRRLCRLASTSQNSDGVGPDAEDGTAGVLAPGEPGAPTKPTASTGIPSIGTSVDDEGLADGDSGSSDGSEQWDDERLAHAVLGKVAEQSARQTEDSDGSEDPYGGRRRAPGA